MPQIWLTCDELAQILELDSETVHAQAASSRRQIREGFDGVTRILLSDGMAREYIRLQAETELAERMRAETVEIVAAMEIVEAPEVVDAPQVVEIAEVAPAMPVEELPIVIDRPAAPLRVANRGATVGGTVIQISSFWDRCRHGFTTRGGLVQDRASISA